MTEFPVSPENEPGPPAAPDVDTSTIALVGFLGAIVLVAIMIALQVVYYHVAAAEFRMKDLDQPIVELQQVNSAQLAQLARYRWIDQPKGVVAIPIERAMELVVRESATSPKPPSPAPPSNAGGVSHAKP